MHPRCATLAWVKLEARIVEARDAASSTRGSSSSLVLYGRYTRSWAGISDQLPGSVSSPTSMTGVTQPFRRACAHFRVADAVKAVQLKRPSFVQDSGEIIFRGGSAERIRRRCRLPFRSFRTCREERNDERTCPENAALRRYSLCTVPP